MTVYGPDPTWTGSGNKNAWVEQYKPYRIHWSNLAGLDASITGRDAVLENQPHPTDYFPAKIVATGGNGRPIRMGYPTAVWYFSTMTAGQMHQLFTARDYANAQYGGLLYIVTRTDNNTLTTNAVSGWQQLQYSYATFRCYMRDITYETKHDYYYQQVKVEFSHLVSA